MPDDKPENPSAAFTGFETWQLVDELLRRGWDTTTRVRNGKERRILLAPSKESTKR